MLSAFLWWFIGMIIMTIGALIPIIGIPLMIIGAIVSLVGAFKFMMILWRKLFGTSASSAVAAPSSTTRPTRQGSCSGTL